MTTQSVRSPDVGSDDRTTTSSIVIQSGLVIGTLLCLTVGMLDWVVSGSISRNSYSSFRAAQSLGLDELTPFRIIWYLVPVFTAAVFFALSGKWVRIAAGILFVQATIVGIAGIGVSAMSVPVGNGPMISAVSGIASLLWSAWALVAVKR